MEGTVTISLEDYEAFKASSNKVKIELDTWNKTLELFNDKPGLLLDYIAANPDKRVGDCIFELHKQRVNG